MNAEQEIAATRSTRPQPASNYLHPIKIRCVTQHNHSREGKHTISHELARPLTWTSAKQLEALLKHAKSRTHVASSAKQLEALLKHAKAEPTLQAQQILVPCASLKQEGPCMKTTWRRSPHPKNSEHICSVAETVQYPVVKKARHTQRKHIIYRYIHIQIHTYIMCIYMHISICYVFIWVYTYIYMCIERGRERDRERERERKKKSAGTHPRVCVCVSLCQYVCAVAIMFVYKRNILANSEQVFPWAL